MPNLAFLASSTFLFDPFQPSKTKPNIHPETPPKTQKVGCLAGPPRPPISHFVCQKQLQPSLRLAFVIIQNFYKFLHLVTRSGVTSCEKYLNQAKVICQLVACRRVLWVTRFARSPRAAIFRSICKPSSHCSIDLRRKFMSRTWRHVL